MQNQAPTVKQEIKKKKKQPSWKHKQLLACGQGTCSDQGMEGLEG